MSSVPMEREEEGPSATCQYRPEAKDVSRVIELYLHSFLKSCTCFAIRHDVTGPLFTPCLPHKNVAGFLLLAPVERSTVGKNSTLVRVLVWIHSLSCLILLSWNINHTGDCFLLFFFTPMTFN